MGLQEARMVSGTRMGRVGLALAAAASAMMLSGCLVSGRSHQSTTGSYVGPSTFNQIEAGSTRQDWVVATLGAPTSKTCLEDGSEIWKWAYTKTKSGSGSVFLLYHGSDDSTSPGATFVHLKDGVVIKAWRD